MVSYYLDDLAPGQRFSSSTRIRIDEDRIKTFAAEFDPQPFHLEEGLASTSVFRGLAASGWHTAAITMRLLVDSEFKPAGGIVGAGFEELRWPRPVRPGDELRVEQRVLDRVRAPGGEEPTKRDRGEPSLVDATAAGGRSLSAE